MRDNADANKKLTGKKKDGLYASVRIRQPFAMGVWEKRCQFI